MRRRSTQHNTNHCQPSHPTTKYQQPQTIHNLGILRGYTSGLRQRLPHRSRNPGRWVRTFPYPNIGCPACGHTTSNTAHMLRSCKSIRHLLNAWLRQVAPAGGARRMRLNELDFVRTIFDLSSIPTIKDRRATVNFVWDSAQAAIRPATCRGNGN